MKATHYINAMISVKAKNVESSKAILTMMSMFGDDNNCSMLGIVGNDSSPVFGYSVSVNSVHVYLSAKELITFLILTYSYCGSLNFKNLHHVLSFYNTRLDCFDYEHLFDDMIISSNIYYSDSRIYEDELLFLFYDVNVRKHFYVVSIDYDEGSIIEKYNLKKVEIDFKKVAFDYDAIMKTIC